MQQKIIFLFFSFLALSTRAAATTTTMRVVTILDEPFLMLNYNQNLTGNNKYTGYCADLMTRLSQMLNSSYELQIVKDGRFGMKDENGSWNGIIGELVRSEADLGLAPLTISAKREMEIDFSHAFMETGISLMIKRPFKESYFFRFISPFDVIWFISLIGYLSVTIGLYFLSTYKSFNMKRSLAWCFFTFLLLSVYIFNLSAYLAFEVGSGINVPIKSVEDLLNRQDMRYGVIESGSTQQFFRNSNNTVYKEIWNSISSFGSSVMVKNNQEGFLKVKEGGGYYAFFIESVMNDYFSEQSDCGVMKVGKNLDSKSYGLATQNGSPLMEKINTALLKLKEEGYLHDLKTKWWNKPGNDCSVKEFIHSGYYLSKVSIIMFILIAGAFIAVLIQIIELLKDFC